MSENHEISAVHSEDVVKLLNSLNLLQEVNEGRIHCKFCGRMITLDNFACIYPRRDEIIFCCDQIKCFEKAIQDSKGGEM